jgi:hypothetical protein
MSDITDWEPEIKPETNLEEKYTHELKMNARLILDGEKLKTQNQKLIRKNASLLSDSEDLTAKFTCLKADAITTLKAIDLCLLATLNTEKQQLTHRARNFRMRHVHQIICNQIDALCDRKLTSYEDGF